MDCRSFGCRVLSRLLVIACLFGLPHAAAAAGDDPVGAWLERLARIESDLRSLPTGDPGARERVASDLSRLRGDVAGWLAEFPPAQNDERPWLEEAGSGSAVEDLAAEVGRLRSALSRIAGALSGGDTAGAFYLGRVEVSVTASATTSATTDMTPAGATVLDAGDLRANDRTALAGAIALAPGVSFVRVGSRNETAVYVRGFDMRQVPLFIDGIPIYTPYDGYVDLDRFTTFDVSEVRVSKGFASVLYGPNALGGAINIVSRRPSRRVEGTAGAAYGSGSSKNLFVNAGSRLDRWYLQGGGSYLESDTFPLAGGFAGNKTQPAGDRVNAHRRDGKFNLKVGWTPNGTDEYAVSYVGQRGEKGNPPYAGNDPLVRTRYWRWPYWDKDSFYFVSNTSIGSLGYVRARAFRDEYDNALHSYDDATFTTQLRSSSFQSLYRDRAHGASLEWGGTFGRQDLRAAAHFKQDSHQDRSSGEPPKEFEGRVVSIGVEDSVRLSPRLSLVAGIGADWQSTTLARDYQKGRTSDLLAACADGSASCGDADGVNPQAGFFYAVPTGQLRFTVARKTRMPSMKDRYSFKFGTAVPNPDLRAERNLTLEGGYQGTLGSRTSFHASAFYSRIDDLVQRFYLQPNLSQQRNIGRASNAGLELDARAVVNRGLELGANYTYLHRENISDPSTPLVDTPEHKGRVSAIATPSQSLQLIAALEFEAGRQAQNDAGSYVDAPAFVTLNLKSVWTIRRQVDAELGVFNAFDASYWVADGYPEPGRTVLANLRWQF